MFLCCWLVLGALIPLTLSTDPGVKVKLTAKGLEYGTDSTDEGHLGIQNLAVTFPGLYF